MVERFTRNLLKRPFALVVFITLHLSSCSLILKTSDVDLKNADYQIKLQREQWKETEKDTADRAWGRPSTGSNLVANSYCKKYQTSSLQSLTEHLFHGVQDLKILEQKLVPTHQREGLHTIATGLMDGVEFHIMTRVFNRDNCTYDLTLVRAANFDQEDKTAFDDVLNSFHFSSGATP